MQPVTYDFDVITDAPAQKRRPLPGPAEQSPQADAEREQGRAAPPERDERGRARAAE